MAWEAYLKDVAIAAPNADIVVEFREPTTGTVVTKAFHHNIDDANFTWANVKTEILTYMGTLNNKITKLNQLQDLVGTKIV